MHQFLLSTFTVASLQRKSLSQSHNSIEN